MAPGSKQLLAKIRFTIGPNCTGAFCHRDLALSMAPYVCVENREKGMTKFTVIASLTVFMIGAVVGRATAPMPMLAAIGAIESISVDELTRNSGPLPVETADAI